MIIVEELIREFRKYFKGLLTHFALEIENVSVLNIPVGYGHRNRVKMKLWSQRCRRLREPIYCSMKMLPKNVFMRIKNAKKASGFLRIINYLLESIIPGNL
jgi:hypothetical protein